MFIFPLCALGDKLNMVPCEEHEGYSEMLRMDHMRYLKVPFCINVMSGGQYGEKWNIRFGGISGEKKFAAGRDADGISGDGNMTFPDEWGIKLHQHDYYEFMYVLEGAVEQQIESSTYLYKKGEGCFINRNTKHCEISGKDFFVVYLCLSKEYVGKLLENVRKTSGIIYRFLTANLTEMSAYKKDYLYVSAEAEAGIQNIYELLEQMAKELMERSPGYLHIFHGLVERLFYELQDQEYHRILYIPLASTVEEQLFEQIKSLVEENPGRYGRQELSSELNYSGDYLNRIVKKFTGYPIGRYCQKILLHKAKSLLTETDLSVAEVIECMGFKNHTHFYGMFKDEFGMLPGEYRKVYGQKGCQSRTALCRRQ